jgi:hypothetical protein
MKFLAATGRRHGGAVRGQHPGAGLPGPGPGLDRQGVAGAKLSRTQKANGGNGNVRRGGSVGLPDRLTGWEEIEISMMKRETFAIASIYVPVKRRATLPFSAARGARLLLHMLSYHDDRRPISSAPSIPPDRPRPCFMPCTARSTTSSPRRR